MDRRTIEEWYEILSETWPEFQYDRRNQAWLTNQKYKWRQGKLKAWQIEILTDLGIKPKARHIHKLTDHDPRWKLLQENADRNKGKYKREDGKFDDWVRYQTYKARNGKLPDSQYEKLLKAGVKVSVFTLVTFKEWAEQLKSYQLRTNKEYPSATWQTAEENPDYQLGKWAARMRQAFLTLPDHHQKLLQDLPLGFTLDIRAQKWYLMYRSAKRFYKKYGHLDVPNKKKNKALYNWLTGQRADLHRSKKNKKLNHDDWQERINLLNEIGMRWEGNPQTRKRNALKDMAEIDKKIKEGTLKPIR